MIRIVGWYWLVGIGWLVLIGIDWAVQCQFSVCGCWAKKEIVNIFAVCVGGGGGGFIDPCHAREYQLGVPSRYWGSPERPIVVTTMRIVN